MLFISTFSFGQVYNYSTLYDDVYHSNYRLSADNPILIEFKKYLKHKDSYLVDEYFRLQKKRDMFVKKKALNKSFKRQKEDLRSCKSEVEARKNAEYYKQKLKYAKTKMDKTETSYINCGKCDDSYDVYKHYAKKYNELVDRFNSFGRKSNTLTKKCQEDLSNLKISHYKKMLEIDPRAYDYGDWGLSNSEEASRISEQVSSSEEANEQIGIYLQKIKALLD